MHNIANWQTEVAQASYGRPVVVLFHADTCAPCQRMKPVVARLADELGFLLLGLDCGALAPALRDVVRVAGVRNVPSLRVYKDGAMLPPLPPGPKDEEALRSYLAAAGVPA